MKQKINLLTEDRIEVKCWRCDHTHFLSEKELKRKNINCLCGAKLYIRDGQITKFVHPAEKIPAYVIIGAYLTNLNRMVWKFERHLRDTFPFAVFIYVGWTILFLVTLFS